MVSAIACALCGLPTSVPLAGADGQAYCCPACREVAGLLANPLPERTSQASTPLNAIELSVAGLWCSSCAWLVAESLRRVPGVATADVRMLQRSARVTYNPQVTAPRRLVGAIRRLGYQARLPGEQPYDEEEALFTRLAICGVFVLHDVVTGLILYGRTLLGLNTPEEAWMVTFFQAMMLLGAVPLVLLLGIPILRAGLAGFVRGRPDMHTLITIGVLAALGLSVRNLILGNEHVYFDTVTMLLFLVACGRWLDLRAQRVGTKALDALLRQIPQQASWITSEGERQVAPEELPLGARVRVRPGERFPVDGLVAIGEGEIDESLLTGEPLPLRRRPGERVLAGTYNLDGLFELITTATGANTAAGQIGHVLNHALWDRAPLERLADRLAAWMVPLALVLALAAFVIWMPGVGVEQSLMIALTVLLIACPCALGIATPLALTVALGRAAQSGVVLRSSAAIEQFGRVRSMFFDKTGTLTRLPLRLQAVATTGIDQQTLLERVAAVESASEHPLARALVAAAPAVTVCSDFRVWPGRGVSGQIGDLLLLVGGERLMIEHKLDIPAELAEQATSWQTTGLAVIYAGWGNQVHGVFGFGERLRDDVPETLMQLKALGVEVGVLTGDTVLAGQRWQAQLGIPVEAGLAPAEKLTRLQAAAGPLAMVGDGINDGPALATAGVGIAMRHAADVAQAAADAVLVGDDLRSIPWLLQLSRLTIRVVRQNLAWAFVYNLVGIGLALAGQLQPVLAALAMVLSSVLVTSNSLRLRRLPVVLPSTDIASTSIPDQPDSEIPLMKAQHHEALP